MNKLEEQGIILGERKARFFIMLECWECGEDSFHDVFVVGPGVYTTCPHCKNELIISTMPRNISEQRIRQRAFTRQLQKHLRTFLEADMR